MKSPSVVPASSPSELTVSLTSDSDETRHAQLAWKTAKWALSKGGDDVRAAVSLVLLEPEKFAPGPSEDLGEAGEAHGRLCAKSSKRVINETIRCVLRPCAAMLFGHEDGVHKGGEESECVAVTQIQESVMGALV